MINKFDLWIANLNPAHGSEVDKVGPVVVVQTNYMNEFNPTILVCPISSNPWEEKTNHLHLPANLVGLDKESVLLLDQIRSLDRRRLIQRIGMIPDFLHDTINHRLKIILDII